MAVALGCMGEASQYSKPHQGRSAICISWVPAHRRKEIPSHTHSQTMAVQQQQGLKAVSNKLAKEFLSSIQLQYECPAVIQFSSWS
jgi:hypothetical protein